MRQWNERQRVGTERLQNICTYVNIYEFVYTYMYLQWTCNFIRLLTDGGTIFDAMHKYTPISDRVILVNQSVSPSTANAVYG